MLAMANIPVSSGISAAMTLPNTNSNMIATTGSV